MLGRRDAEILEWINSHYCDRYVVLDDDDFDLTDVKQKSSKGGYQYWYYNITNIKKLSKF